MGEAIGSVEPPQPVHYVQLQKLFVPSYTTGMSHKGIISSDLASFIVVTLIKSPTQTRTRYLLVNISRKDDIWGANKDNQTWNPGIAMYVRAFLGLRTYFNLISCEIVY